MLRQDETDRPYKVEMNFEAAPESSRVIDAHFGSDEAVKPDDSLPPDGRDTTPTSVGDLAATLGQLQESFEAARLRAEISRNETSAQLQALSVVHRTLADIVDENHKMRSGEYEKILEPVLRDLVGLAEDLNILLANAGHASLRTAITLITEILDRYGAAEVAPAPMDKFDPALHAGVARLTTADKTVDGLIAELVAPGYRTAQSFLLYPRVKVYRYLPA